MGPVILSANADISRSTAQCPNSTFHPHIATGECAAPQHQARRQRSSSDRARHPGRNMDRKHVKDAADKVKGAIKDTASDKKLQSEGKFDKGEGFSTQP
jgi:hypothetical protein